MPRKLAPARTSIDRSCRTITRAARRPDATRHALKNESAGYRQGSRDCLRKDNATMINVGELTNRNRAAGRVCGLLAQ